MKIVIETIPHDQQRYETVGDWWWENGDLQMRISDMKDWKYEFLVAYHEFAEAILCKDRGITQAAVDAFDKNFEKEREAGKHADDDEAGDASDAPYRKEHFMATTIERLMASELDVNWKSYDDTVMNL